MSEQEKERPSWVEYYMNMAFCVSMRSKDRDLQVGCVIVHRKTLRVLSVGYNGFPPGIENEDQNWQKENKSDLVVHAEANAVLLAGQADLEDSIAFVTMFPCLECAKMLIAKGVRKVYYLSLKDKYYQDSIDIFKAAEVKIKLLKRGEDTTLEEFKVDLIDRLETVIAQMQFEAIYQDLGNITEHIKLVEDTTLEIFKVDLINKLENVMKQMQKQQLLVEANGTYQDLRKITEHVRRVKDTALKEFKVYLIDKLENVKKQMQFEIIYENLLEITGHIRRVEYTKLEEFKVDLIDRLENVMKQMQFEAIYQDLRKLTRHIRRVEDATLKKFKVDLINKLENVMKLMQKRQLPVEANETYQDLRKITEHVGRVEETALEEFKVDLINKLENVMKQMQKQRLPVEANGAYQDLQQIAEHIRGVEDTKLEEFKEDLIKQLENVMKQLEKQQLPVDANGMYQDLRKITEHIERVEDTASEEFKEDLIKKLENVMKQMQKQLPVEANGTYQDLWKITEHRRRKDLRSPWLRVFKIEEILLDSWPDYFLFLALMASTRALENPQGVTLIDSTTFKVSALAYNGDPRGVRSNMQNDSMQVSALTNAICLRWSEGNDFYAFSTHFPSIRDVKNLTQAKVKRLYFIWPKSLEGDNKRALEIMQKAGMKVVPMDVPNFTKLKRAMEKTIKHLQDVEEKNDLPFSRWPSHCCYELQPE